jgi:DNA-binding response OmpR family regulator
MIGTSTVPQRSKRAPILVVHDALNTMSSILEDFRTSFSVDEASDALETLQALALRRYACVVCRVSDAMRVQSFCRLVDGAPTTPPPLVFLVGKDVSIDDLAYMQRNGQHWLAEGHGPAEVTCLVRAVALGVSSSPNPRAE